MSILAWIIVGLIGGWIASRLMGAGGYSLIIDIAVGILGAVVGGSLFSWLARIDVTLLNFESIAVSVAGTITLIVLFSAMVPGPATE